MLFATVSSAAGLSILYYGVNGLTAALGLTNLILYTSIYTPMKRMSILNTWVGSIGEYRCPRLNAHIAKTFRLHVITI